MKKTPCELVIENKKIGHEYPTYFIADIAANHDGDIERAKALIWEAKKAGADAAKFQHFKAETIVSDYGFRQMNSQKSHQATWKKSVFEVYKAASVSLDWTEQLKETCNAAGITFFTSPYALDLVDAIDSFVPAYKIGSGDITWLEIIEYIASKGKPYILATGASTMDDVDRAVRAALAINPQLALLQCNTNYIGGVDNMRYLHLNVIQSYRTRYPDLVLGLSDHTPGDVAVLGAVALGARIIEKHFTDDVTRCGPDHAFSMDPRSWKKMVKRTRELEAALGGEVKKVEENEQETVVLQRRSLRLTRDLPIGHVLRLDDVACLRPCSPDALSPYHLHDIIGRVLCEEKRKGDYLKMGDLLRREIEAC